MIRFTLPRDLYCGPGAIESLKVLKGHQKAIICTGGSSMRRGGFLQKTEKFFRRRDCRLKLWRGLTGSVY